MSSALSAPQAQSLTTGPTHESSNLALVCRQIVQSTAVDIQGKKFVKVEGWQSLAAADHCIPDIIRVEGVEVTKFGMIVQGVRAECVLRRESDGAVISRAFGFVGEDEYDGPESVDYYAMEAKAQTRAISRVCRNKYAFIVVMIDANLETTPADEVPPGGFANRQPAKALVGNTPPQQRNWNPRTTPPSLPEPKPVQVNQRQPFGSNIWDGVVKEVVLRTGMIKTGRSAGQPYNLYICKLRDGREALTFDDKLGELAQKATGFVCGFEIQPAKKQGKFTLIAIHPPRSQNAEPDQGNPDDYPDEPNGE